MQAYTQGTSKRRGRPTESPLTPHIRVDGKWLMARKPQNENVTTSSLAAWITLSPGSCTLDKIGWALSDGFFTVKQKSRHETAKTERDRCVWGTPSVRGCRTPYASGACTLYDFGRHSILDRLPFFCSCKHTIATLLVLPPPPPRAAVKVSLSRLSFISSVDKSVPWILYHRLDVAWLLFD